MRPAVRPTPHGMPAAVKRRAYTGSYTHGASAPVEESGPELHRPGVGRPGAVLCAVLDTCDAGGVVRDVEDQRRGRQVGTLRSALAVDGGRDGGGGHVKGTVEELLDVGEVRQLVRDRGGRSAEVLTDRLLLARGRVDLLDPPGGIRDARGITARVALAADPPPARTVWNGCGSHP